MERGNIVHTDRCVSWRMLSVLMIFAVIILAAGAGTATANTFDKPVEYAPIQLGSITPERSSAAGLESGLSVVYYLEYFERNLDAMPKAGASSRFKKVTGAPILQVNHQFGKEEVFESGAHRGVAARMNGYLSLVEVGDYQFQALSNDGVRVMLTGKTLITDAEQHSDRLSNIGSATIEQPGYYALEIEYFQRKGTAALKLFWKTPGDQEFVPIPQNVYVHLP